MSDPRQAISTQDVLMLIQTINTALGKVKRPPARARLLELRVKLQRIGQSDAKILNEFQP